MKFFQKCLVDVNQAILAWSYNGSPAIQEKKIPEELHATDEANRLHAKVVQPGESFLGIPNAIAARNHMQGIIFLL